MTGPKAVSGWMHWRDRCFAGNLRDHERRRELRALLHHAVHDGAGVLDRMGAFAENPQVVIGCSGAAECPQTANLAIERIGAAVFCSISKFAQIFAP